MKNECEALPGVAHPGVRDNHSTLNTKTGYDDDDEYNNATCLMTIFQANLINRYLNATILDCIGACRLDVERTTGAIRRAELQSTRHLLPNQQCHALKPSITFHGVVHPKLTWGPSSLSPTNGSSYL